MRIKILGAFAAAMLASVFVAASAGAATTIGSSCTPVNSMGTSPPGIIFTPAVDTAGSSGVLTSWTLRTDGPMPGAPIGIAVLQQVGASNWKVVQTTPVIMTGLATTAEYKTRLPIAAGQVVALWGDAPYCTGSDTIYYSALSDPPAVGDVYSVGGDAATPAFTAKLEPDVDNDGYGDETQDGCPQSGAIVNTPCVTVKPSAVQLTSANAFKLLLTSNIGATATATGTVTLPSAKGKKGKKLTFSSKPVAIGPVAFGVVSLGYPKKLKSAIRSLSRKKKLKLAVDVVVDGPIAGLVDATTLKYAKTIRGGAR